MATASPDVFSLSPAQARAAALALRDLILGGEQFRQTVAKRFGLRPAEATALSHLASGDSLSSTQLAQRAGITQGAVTALVDRMEIAGHIVRVPSGVDRRRHALQVTAAGQHILDFAQTSLVRALENLSDTELRRMTVLLRELATATRVEAARLAQSDDTHPRSRGTGSAKST